jgi:hypothetical protein
MGIEPSTRGYTWSTRSQGIQIRRNGPPGWGSLESETVKYGHQSPERLCWRVPAAIVNGRPVLSLGRNYILLALLYSGLLKTCKSTKVLRPISITSTQQSKQCHFFLSQYQLPDFPTSVQNKHLLSRSEASLTNQW